MGQNCSKSIGNFLLIGNSTGKCTCQSKFENMYPWPILKLPKCTVWFENAKFGPCDYRYMHNHYKIAAQNIDVKNWPLRQFAMGC